MQAKTYKFNIKSTVQKPKLKYVLRVKEKVLQVTKISEYTGKANSEITYYFRFI